MSESAILCGQSSSDILDVISNTDYFDYVIMFILVEKIVVNYCPQLAKLCNTSKKCFCLMYEFMLHYREPLNEI